MDSRDDIKSEDKNPFYIDHGRRKATSTAHLALSRVSSLLVIGVGNEFRSDDAAGIHVARGLESRRFPGVKIIEIGGEGAGLMEKWKDAEAVILIDAVRSGSDPGTIHRLDAARNKVPSDFFHYSSHAFGVAEAVELSREMGKIPASVVIYGIEGKDFGQRIGLSPEVTMSVKAVIEIIEVEIESLMGFERKRRRAI